MRKYFKPQPYAVPTKDLRFAGTFEVLVAVPDRVKPQHLAQHFPTLQAAEGWMRSEEGREAVAKLFAAHKPARQAKPAKAGKAAKPAKTAKKGR